MERDVIKQVCKSPALILLLASDIAAATGPYTSAIKVMQITSIDHPYNTVHLVIDVSDSPCTSTNQHDRFHVQNSLQHSGLLAALMAGKPVTIYGTGSCNSVGIETIGDVRIGP